MITPSTIVSAETQADPDQLWDLSFLFLANWAEKVTVNTSWLTDISSSKRHNQSRVSYIGKPYRSIVYSWLEQLPIPAESLLTRMGVARTAVPLFCDAAALTAANVSSASVYCQTANRRFFEGGRVVLVSPSGTYGYGIIDSVESDHLVLTAATTATYPLGSSVIPVFESSINLQSDVDLLTSRVRVSQFTVKEVVGVSALDPLATPGTNPDGFPTHNGLPVLNLKMTFDKLKASSFRAGEIVPSGVSTHVVTYGTPQGQRLAKYLFDDRADAFALLRFFDSRAGRNFPFWFPSQSQEYTITEVTNTTHIKVTAKGPLLDWKYRPYIYIHKTDNSYVIRKITAYSRSSGIDSLTLATELPLSVSLLTTQDAGICLLACFNSDAIAEEWSSTGVMSAQLDIVEVSDSVPETGEDPELPAPIDDPVFNEDRPDEDDPTGDYPIPTSPSYLLFVRAKRCDTNAYVDAWLRVSDIPSYPYVVHPYDMPYCIYFGSSNTKSRFPGSVLTSYTVYPDCTTCRAGEVWTKTIKCLGGDYNIYFSNKAGVPVPVAPANGFFDLRTGIVFYTSTTVGTLPGTEQAHPVFRDAVCTSASEATPWEQARSCKDDSAYPLWQLTADEDKDRGVFFDTTANQCFYWPETPDLVAEPGVMTPSAIEQVTDCFDSRCPVSCTDCADVDVSLCSPTMPFVIEPGPPSAGEYELTYDEGEGAYLYDAGSFIIMVRCVEIVDPDHRYEVSITAVEVFSSAWTAKDAILSCCPPRNVTMADFDEGTMVGDNGGIVWHIPA